MARKKSKKGRPKKNIGNRLAWIMVGLALILVVLTVAIVLPFRWFSPPISAYMIQERFHGSPVDYRWVPLSRISAYVPLAVIASEDQNFFNHWGIDMDAVADAIEENRDRETPRGASTISQQVVKNLFLWPTRSYFRKALEVYLTVAMELLWPKRRILEVYLNITEMGSGVFGVEAAGQRFFQRSAADLNQGESATLAAVLPNPKKMLAARPSAYVHLRRSQIVAQMKALGGIAFLRKALGNT